MSEKETRKNIPMRELEKLTDFSRATINYYIREGILPIPEKSAKNMAYYDHDFINKLEKINKLKKSGFTLNQIRLFLKSEQEMDNDYLLQVLNNINRLLPNDSDESLVTMDQIMAIGFDEKGIQDLIQINLISPVNKEGTLFPSYSLTVAEFIKYFMGYGIPLTVAKSAVQKILDLIKIEKDAFLQYIRKPLMEKEAPLEEQSRAVQECIEKINALLPLIHLQLLKLPTENLLKMASE